MINKTMREIIDKNFIGIYQPVSGKKKEIYVSNGKIFYDRGGNKLSNEYMKNLVNQLNNSKDNNSKHYICKYSKISNKWICKNIIQNEFGQIIIDGLGNTETEAFVDCQKIIKWLKRAIVLNSENNV